MELIIALLVAGAVMGLLDFIWLGFVAKKLYYGAMGDILRKKPNMVAALIFYVIYVVGTVVFVINPALATESLLYAVGYGAFFGFVAYATYDFTNLSVTKGFSAKIAVIDTIWGAALTMIVSVATYAAVTALF